MKRKPQIIIGIALIAVFVILAIAAPLLAPNDPNATNLALKMLRHPQNIHWAVTRWEGVNCHV